MLEAVNKIQLTKKGIFFIIVRCVAFEMFITSVTINAKPLSETDLCIWVLSLNIYFVVWLSILLLRNLQVETCPPYFKQYYTCYLWLYHKQRAAKYFVCRFHLFVQWLKYAELSAADIDVLWQSDFSCYLNGSNLCNIEGLPLDCVSPFLTEVVYSTSSTFPVMSKNGKLK